MREWLKKLFLPDDGGSKGYVSLTPRRARPHDGRVAAHRIAFVIFPDFQSLDLTGPFEVFAGANQRLGRAAYELTTVATTAGPVRSNSGLTITADRSIKDVKPGDVDTLIVAGGSGVLRAKDDEQLMAWIGQVFKHCKRVVSVCTGTFLLAAAGVVVDERVTTHWAYADKPAESTGSVPESWLARLQHGGHLSVRAAGARRAVKRRLHRPYAATPPLPSWSNRCDTCRRPTRPDRGELRCQLAM